MSECPQKINNSYESGSSSSSACSGSDQVLALNPFDNMEGRKLAHLLIPESEHDLCNSSVEEGIFPNVLDYQHITVPSYQPDYDYNNDYSNTPLVYSWLPIVPGFNQDGFDNLQHFQHIDKNFYDGSLEISNQNEKYHEHLVINNPNPKLLNNHSGMDFQDLENSCNAMDLNISCAEETAGDHNLSFNGKLAEMKAQEEDPVRQIQFTEETLSLEIELTVETAKQSEEERLHNESLELLKKEDSSRMLHINEKSPDLFDSEGELPSDNEPVEEAFVKQEVVNYAPKTSEDCDSAVREKLQRSLTHLRSSGTKPHLSLSEMLELYKKNVNASPTATVKSSSFFIPSHKPTEIASMEWPSVRDAKCFGVSYNKSTTSEDIEVFCNQYGERYIGAETSSSYNLKIGPSSAKKRMEKLKLQTQSPGRRLSHLAKRRTMFSAANLKSSSLTASHSSSSLSGAFQIEIKSKLSSKSNKAKSPKKRTSAKKKTPGKRKTPKSAKRQMIPEPSRVSSKRALFTSPVEPCRPLISSLSQREISLRGRLPRRTLFSPSNNENKKRKRSTSPDGDAENHAEKSRRLKSPTRIHKSQSFSIAPSSSTSTLDEHFRKRLIYRTQSETVAQKTEGTYVQLGYKEKLTKEKLAKILWSVSNALKSKGIVKENDNYNQCATLLAKLVKEIFTEFYNPAINSVSEQLSKFANFMVSYVVQSRSFEEIYQKTKEHLQSKNSTKTKIGYIAKQDYEFNMKNIVRRNDSLLMMSQSSSSLNFSRSTSFYENCSLNSSKLSESNSSLNLSSSKNNDMRPLRENFIGQSNEKSTKKISASDSNLNKLKSSSSSNLMKAKRQISF